LLEFKPTKAFVLTPQRPKGAITPLTPLTPENKTFASEAFVLTSQRPQGAITPLTPLTPENISEE